VRVVAGPRELARQHRLVRAERLDEAPGGTLLIHPRHEAGVEAGVDGEQTGPRGLVGGGLQQPDEHQRRRTQPVHLVDDGGDAVRGGFVAESVDEAVVDPGKQHHHVGPMGRQPDVELVAQRPAGERLAADALRERARSGGRRGTPSAVALVAAGVVTLGADEANPEVGQGRARRGVDAGAGLADRHRIAKGHHSYVARWPGPGGDAGRRTCCGSECRNGRGHHEGGAEPLRQSCHPWPLMHADAR
jgi:hypothetical protein